MPTIRRLTPQEVQGLENKGKGQRKLTEEQYDTFLAGYGPGDYGEAELDEDENRLTVRSRFKAAAARRGLSLTFQRTNGNLLRFRIASGAAGVAEAATPPAAEPEPAVEPEPPSTPQAMPKGCGRRRRAAVAPAGRQRGRAVGGWWGCVPERQSRTLPCDHGARLDAEGVPGAVQ